MGYDQFAMIVKFCLKSLMYFYLSFSGRLGQYLSLKVFFLFQVRFVVMSFLTNCLVDGVGEEGKGGEAALSQTLMQIFGGSSGVFAFAQSYPTVRFFISPPNVRNKPTWFPRFRPVILQAFQQILSNRPPNLQVLKDKSGELDPDGVHFSLMAGILFVQDLHNQAVQLMLTAMPDPKIR